MGKTRNFFILVTREIATASTNLWHLKEAVIDIK